MAESLVENQDQVCPQCGSPAFAGHTPSCTINKSEQTNTENKTELILTPEVEQMIMDKVTDINCNGTAFSSVNRHSSENASEYLCDLFKYGFLGKDTTGRSVDTETRIKELREDIKQRKSEHSSVWFNIVGRMRDVRGKHQIADASMGLGKFNIILNISDFEEMSQVTLDDINPAVDSKPSPSNTFRPAYGSVGTMNVPYYFSILKQKTGKDEDKSLEHNKYKVFSAQGFQTPYRMSPRRFLGAVVNNPNDETINEVVITMAEADNERPERLLPVYNLSGDLLWPRQMTNKELKKFVSERDKNKK
ncbi:MAG: hypothetical protein NTW79_02940 [Candidatus Berkelbacteria bacterium]|nr:hypothetical protein [Candidatus Berkelbacteria bacterium]